MLSPFRQERDGEKRDGEREVISLAAGRGGTASIYVHVHVDFWCRRVCLPALGARTFLHISLHGHVHV